MKSIRADNRHTQLIETRLSPSEKPRFPAWRMACFGPSSFMSRHLQPLLERHPQPLTGNEVSNLISMIQAIAVRCPNSATF